MSDRPLWHEKAIRFVSQDSNTGPPVIRSGSRGHTIKSPAGRSLSLNEMTRGQGAANQALVINPTTGRVVPPRTNRPRKAKP